MFSRYLNTVGESLICVLSTNLNITEYSQLILAKYKAVTRKRYKTIYQRLSYTSLCLHMTHEGFTLHYT